MESLQNEPDYENVVFIDEYPELAKKVWLRRLHRSRQLGSTSLKTEIIVLPTFDTPEDAS